MTIGGTRRKVVVTSGKPGIFEGLDAATGRFLFARDPGAQNVVKSIDPVTGVKVLLEPGPPDGITKMIVPIAAG